LQIARDWVRRFDDAGSAHGESIFHVFRVTNSAHPRRPKGMQTEISPYDATGYRDARKHVALLRANIMHLVDLKRGGTLRVVQKCGSTASPIGRGQFRVYRKCSSRRLTFPRWALLSERPSQTGTCQPGGSGTASVVVFPAASLGWDRGVATVCLDAPTHSLRG
jgi:hypothetical protein